MNEVKTAIDNLDINKKYKLECGHNNFALINIYPFKTFICLNCGFKTKRVLEDKEE